MNKHFHDFDIFGKGLYVAKLESNLDGEREAS